MASRLARRWLLQAIRPKSAHSTGSKCDNGLVMIRRKMTSSSHGEESRKSDTPWIVVSGTITVAGLAYLITPPSKKAAHHVASRAEPSFPSPSHPSTKDAKKSEEEDNETSEEEEKTSDDQPAQENKGDDNKEENEESTSDEDKPVQENNDAEKSDNKSSDEDKASRFDDGAPGQTSAAEKAPDQKVKPKTDAREKVEKPHETGTEAPKDVGDARKQSKQENKVPAQADDN